MIFENGTKAIATCSRGLQLAQIKLSIKYQSCGGSLQSSHQKNIRFDCNSITPNTKNAWITNADQLTSQPIRGILECSIPARLPTRQGLSIKRELLLPVMTL